MYYTEKLQHACLSLLITLCVPISACQIKVITDIRSNHSEPLNIFLTSSLSKTYDKMVGNTISPLIIHETISPKPNQLLRRTLTARDQSGKKVSHIQEIVQLYKCHVINATAIRTPDNITYNIKPLHKAYQSSYVISPTSTSKKLNDTPTPTSDKASDSAPTTDEPAPEKPKKNDQESDSSSMGW
ncbi:MAG: hypothetical protein VXW87_04855 [Pseudomonadota bacterium]|nr:hypothetical protein [Pseudomonadota bacterium]